MVHTIPSGPLHVNVCFVQLDPKRWVLVDPGASFPLIKSFIEEKNAEIEIIALTHGHLDHTGTLGKTLEYLTSRQKAPRIAIHALDADYLGAKGEETNRATFVMIGAINYFKHFWTPMPHPDILLEHGDRLPGTQLEVIHTPGHTKGSVCYYDRTEGFLLSGDTLFAGGVGRTNGPDSDESELLESIGTKILTLPEPTIVIPGHGDRTTISAEKLLFNPE